MFIRYRTILFTIFTLLIAVSTSFAAEKVKVAEKVAEKVEEKVAEKKESAKKVPKQKGRYLRIVKDASGALESLQTAIIQLVPKDPKKGGPTVDLIGAIHVAEPEYYNKLNREFDKYDAVLYELVAPKGTRPEQGQENKNTGFIGSMQHGLTDLLDLEHQLDGINYKRDQFVHADLSPAEFAESMRQRKESVFGYAIRLFAASSAQQAGKDGTEDLAMLAAMFSTNRASAMKRAMAPQFVDMEMAIFLIDGPKGSTLISARNQKAVDVLIEKVGEGKKKIAIFYGAGHLPDLERRAIKQLELKRGKTRWLEAWDLRKKAESK